MSKFDTVYDTRRRLGNSGFLTKKVDSTDVTRTIKESLTLYLYVVYSCVRLFLLWTLMSLYLVYRDR